MAEQVNVDFAARVKVDYGSGLTNLGYTANGVDWASEPHMQDVPGDENGGDAGTPIDIQYFGETARITLELTKYDPAILESIRARIPGGTAGTPAAAGTLLFAGNLFMRLVVASTNRPRNFPCAIPRSAIEVNKGTRFSRARLQFECHKHPTTGVLDNATVN